MNKRFTSFHVTVVVFILVVWTLVVFKVTAVQTHKNTIHDMELSLAGAAQFFNKVLQENKDLTADMDTCRIRLRACGCYD